MTEVKCPECESTSYRKNGHRLGRQNYLCKSCGRQFLEPLPVQVVPINDSNQILVSLAEDNTTNAAQETLLNPAEDNKAADFNILTEKIIQSLLSPDVFESYFFKQLIQKIQDIKNTSKKNNESGIAILLLDVENLKLDHNIESFLAGIAQYNLQVKIAFASWKNPSVGRQDIELYERGYQLIHIPSGASSADAKMIAIGSSIFLQYPHVKEVFVCSCDGILTHLCNELQNKGITVYWVRRQDNVLCIENRNTGETNHYSLSLKTEIPSYENFVKQFEDLVKAEHQSISERLAQLSVAVNLFQERLNITQSINRTNDPKVLNSGEELVKIIPEEKSKQATNKTAEVVVSATTSTVVSSAKNISSREEFEKLIVETIKKMSSEPTKTYISLSQLSVELQKSCGKPAKLIIKELKLGAGLTKFLQSCPSIKLKQSGKQYEVAIAP